MASILNNVTVSQAYSFFLHGGASKDQRGEGREERLTDEVAANGTTGVKR